MRRKILEERRKIEIMAPAGNFECLQTAVNAGAGSVYFGVGKLNMRSHSANNFSMDDLPEICSVCRAAGVKTYLTLNITLYDNELEEMRSVLEAARVAGADAVIASDMAAILAARELGMEVHISTQLSISNTAALRFYAAYADVVVLARELNLHQVREMHETILRENICGPSGQPLRIEMFVHGAFCMAVSGKCYLSLHEYSASANRGECYQVCRRGYEVTDLETGRSLEIDNKYIMSPKDLCTVEFIDKIIEAGVTVFKIEGRARSAEYVRTTVSCYRRAADAVCNGTFTSELAAKLKEELAEVFNRGFWDGYYQGARLGEWSKVYGSAATRRKVYCGKITNWFDKLGVAEVYIEAAELNVGDRILIIGPTTGVLEVVAEEIRVDLHPVPTAPKGVYCSIPVNAGNVVPSKGAVASNAFVPEKGPSSTPDPSEKEPTAASAVPEPAPAPEAIKLRRSDKVYIWKDSENENPVRVPENHRSDSEC